MWIMVMNLLCKMVRYIIVCYWILLYKNFFRWPEHAGCGGLPSIGHFQDSALQSTGPSFLGCAFARRGWTRCFLRCLLTWYSVVLWFNILNIFHHLSSTNYLKEGKREQTKVISTFGMKQWALHIIRYTI